MGEERKRVMDAVQSHPELSADDTPVTRIHHRQHPWDVNFLDKIRGIVSRNKRRYKSDGYDLDLAYITDKIIAMGAPAQGRRGLYRNNMRDVQSFLKQKHQAAGYCVYNLCTEEHFAYKPSKFEMVANFPFDDHQVPPLALIHGFCEHVHSFLREHPRGVAAVHCKAGKGRTGLMICCYLLYAGICKTVDEALHFYAVQRTFDGKGITNPSQTRYVQYFAMSLANMPEQRRVCLKAVSIGGLNWLGSGKTYIKVSCRPTGASEAAKVAKEYLNDRRQASFGHCSLEGDIKIEVIRARENRPNRKLFSAWLQSAYIEVPSIELKRADLDKVAKVVPPSALLQLEFDSADASQKSAALAVPGRT
ncbi:g4055 [Coccomyxa viridis]|uniref:G4055 protein n=1 Tax=Coccomyxa viridis TaxID=1274662 RepID=A0ABP1FPB3_9CHLO